MIKKSRYLLISFLLAHLISIFGCYPALRKQAERPEEALSRVRFFYPKFQDDSDFSSLAQAIRNNLEYLYRLDPQYIFQYGPHEYTCLQVRETHESFLKLIQENSDPGELNERIRRDFLVYRARGRVGNNKVLFTGYYEPVYEGRLIPDEMFKYPIYQRPDDLIKIDLGLFRDEYTGKSIIARIEGKEVLPYFSRKQIEVDNALADRGLEIAWLKDPLDVAFLHIQGSGRLWMSDGSTISVGYRASNGRPYRSIGRYLLDRGLLNREEISMQSIRRYLSGHPEILEEVLNHNPSYVFFGLMENGPFGNIEVPLTPGRSVALDSNIFPKGALCFISTEKPVIDSNDEITGWTKFSRFILNQDTGGAIKGSGRADIFWGNGRHAELTAGHMKHDGNLYILIKKPTK
ncbi:MAG: MltA domain-containing protein [Desulfobacteraceae bacterium]|jgi:membrane-bound lytic murein transglycosylase A